MYETLELRSVWKRANNWNSCRSAVKVWSEMSLETKQTPKEVSRKNRRPTKTSICPHDFKNFYQSVLGVPAKWHAMRRMTHALIRSPFGTKADADSLAGGHPASS
jgi:hypothetical protein